MIRRFGLAVLLASVFVAALPRGVGAHALAPSLLELREVGEAGRFEVRWKTPLVVPAGLSALEPVLPEHCRGVDRPAVSHEGLAAITRWAVDCGETGLVGHELRIAGLEKRQSDVLVRLEWRDGHSIRDLLDGRRTAFAVPERESRGALFGRYLVLGVEHILLGADHLLFVLGLLFLVRGGRALVATITAFTVGHSLTLTAAVLGWAVLPSAPVEVAIAASILVLAVEIARPESAAGETALARWPWVVAVGFGLLHGLGFAGALAEVGLPRGEIPLALLGFNLGIEIGQLAFVAVVFLALRLVRPWGERLPSWARQVPAYAIGSLAAFWVFERLAPLL